MKKIIIAFLLCTILLLPFPAEIVSGAVEGDCIFDYSELLSDSEKTKLEKKIAEYEKSSEVDIIIITTDRFDGKSSKSYLEDFSDEKYDSDEISKDCAFLLVNMNERRMEIQGYGDCEFYISNDRIEYILDDLSPLLKKEKFYDAFLLFAKQIDYYMDEETGISTEYKPGQEIGDAYDGPSNYYGRDKNIYNKTTILILAGVSLLIGGITVGVMSAKSGGSVTASGRTYLDEQNSGVTGHRDVYIRTSVTKVKKPDPPSSNSNGGSRSSGGGGVSSGGRSHSGGGRSF